MSVHLPDELLALIADHVDSRGSLLALALTCSSFYRVIVPAYLYKSVEVSITNPDYLVQLASDPTLIEHVREVTLVIVPTILPATLRHGETVPELSWVETTNPPEDILSKMVAALGLISRLLSLRINLGTQDFFPMSEGALAPIVEKHIARLEHFCLNTHAIYASPSSFIWKAQGLRTLELVYVQRSAWGNLVDVLAHSPELETLGLPEIINFTAGLEDHISLPELPPLPHLPNLRNLSMPPSWSGPAIGWHLFNFLRAHPLVADLRWKSHELPSPEDMPPLTHLRRIRENTAGARFAARFLDDKPVGSVRLTSLECYDRDVLSLNTLRALDSVTLRTVYMQECTAHDVQALAQVFPNIENVKMPSKQVLDAGVYAHVRLSSLAALFPALRAARNVDVGEPVLAPSAPLPSGLSFAEVSRALRAVRAAYPNIVAVNGWRLDDRLGERVVQIRSATKQQQSWSMAPVYTKFVLREDGYSVGYTEPSQESLV